MPAGKGVGPSVVGRLVRDRSVRLAAGLAITVAIPVAIMFYFQFRSLSDLGRASAVVLRQLSQETADAVTKDLQDALRMPRTEVLLKIFQYQTEPLDLPFIQTTFSQGLDTEPFVDGFYVWSDATTEHRDDLLVVRSRAPGGSSPTRRNRRCCWISSRRWRRRNAPSRCSRRSSTGARPTSSRNCGSRSRRAIG